jgi:multimeric flavodoxin WrbA
VKVLAINGSPKKDGNTAYAIEVVCSQLRSAGIETEVFQVGNKDVRGCTACGQCLQRRDGKCVLPGETVNEGLALMAAADGIVLGAPVYFSGIPGTLKSFLDRTFRVAGANGSLFRHKVGVSVVADRRAGGVPVFNQLNNYLHYAEMFMANSNYWNVIFGALPGEAAQDREGTQSMRILGRNMAWLLRAIEVAKAQFPLPEPEPKEMTNFIRP